MPFQRKKPARPLTVDEVLTKMERFCAYRERCPKEVLDQIKLLGLTGNDAQQVYEVLKEDRFFEESRFAFAYVQGKFRVNHWGKVRIRLELQQRQIAPDLIHEALDSIDQDQYLTVLSHLLVQKYKSLQKDEKSYEKTAAYAIRTGFEPSLVFEQMRTISNQFSDDE